MPFQVVGVDFAGPIRYRSRPKTESKAYLALYDCSLTRTVDFDLLKSSEAQEFIGSLKRFIAPRGGPKVVYSDNGATFKTAAKWLQTAQKDEQFHKFLADSAID